MRQAGYVVVGLLAGFLLAGLLYAVTRVPSGTPVLLEPPPTKIPLEVHVIGAVLRPGVYVFVDGSRVQDAIAAAGGLSAGADPDALNLAARLEDGQQVDVPYLGGSTPAPASTSGFRILPSEPTATAATNLIDINTAAVDQLETLPGIGPTIAQNIVDYRTLHGPFAHLEDIMNVAGIGPSTFDSIKDLITQ